jgi:hypothetical protein
MVGWLHATAIAAETFGWWCWISNGLEASDYIGIGIRTIVEVPMAMFGSVPRDS